MPLGRVVIVDDESARMAELCALLGEAGYTTMGFSTAREALNALKVQEYDVFISDWVMPDMGGLSLLAEARKLDPHMVCLVMTEDGTVESAVAALHGGAFDLITKPFAVSQLLPAMTRALHMRQVLLENFQLQETAALYELSQAIACTFDLRAILDKVVDAAMQQCEADEASIMLPLPDTNELYVAIARGKHRDFIVGAREPLHAGIAGWVARHQAPVVLNGEVTDPRFKPIRPRPEIFAAISSPMLVGGTIVGVLNVNSTKRRRSFTTGQVKALNILTSMAASALESVFLFQQTKAAEEKYRSIVENSTEGIFRTTLDGRVLLGNPALARMFGYETPEAMIAAVHNLATEVYVDPAQREAMVATLLAQGEVRNLELHFRRQDRSTFWVLLSGRTVRDAQGDILYFEGAILDIDERKRAEERAVLVNTISERLNNHPSTADEMPQILRLIKEVMEIDAVGIRLRDGDDFTYHTTDGFTDDFIAIENSLLARDSADVPLLELTGHPPLECACGLVLSDRTDPRLSCFTAGGSFWTNAASELLLIPPEAELRTNPRNHCARAGYESVALIPLRSGGEIVGLLQLNARRAGCFTPSMIATFEGLGQSIGIAMSRQQTEAELRASENRMRSLFENMLEGLAYCRLLYQDGKPYDFIYLDVNNAFYTHTGLPNVLWCKASTVITGIQASNPELFEIYGRVAGTGKTERFESYLPGLARWLSISVYSVEPEYFVTVFEDITAQKEAEKSLRDSEERYRQLFEHARDGIALADIATGTLIDCNPALCRMVAREKTELLGQPQAILHPPQPCIDGITPTFLAQTTGDSEQILEDELRAKTGDLLSVEIRAAHIILQGHDYLLGAFRDITERKRAEHELARNNEILNALNTLLGYSLDDQTITQFLERALKLLFSITWLDIVSKGAIFLADNEAKQLHLHVQKGFSPALRTACATVPFGHCLCGRAAATRVVQFADCVDERHDTNCHGIQPHGHYCVPILSGERILGVINLYVKAGHVRNAQEEDFLIGIANTIAGFIGQKQAEAQRVELEEQVRQQQRLDSIGTLASGIAHEINNPINGIMNLAQLIEDELEPANPVIDYSQRIVKETERIATIVRHLLAFARQEHQSHSPGCMADIVEATLSLINTMLRHDQIRVVVTVPDDLPAFKCRSQQIQQVLMNLITNARDALNTKSPDYYEDKVILITVVMLEKDGRRWLRTTVEDHGCGIPEAIRARLFDPFFTTKPRDAGTGLGLSISHGIAKEHHGELTFESEPGQWTRFYLDLPIDNGWEMTS